ncbi:MAG: hypothetical protein KGD64_14895 [Candidatus Heimdallarchaeota archaeon]|nr:hypothetical protein [Candidatus Heimdallarchaeota archaeon]
MVMNGLVSLIFFGIELAILIVVIIFNRDHPHFWSIVALLSLLQLYQLSEFLVCIGVNVGLITRIGFVVITFLPPIGYFLCTRIVKWKFPDYWLGFALALAFSVYFIVDSASVTFVDCNPFFATYQSSGVISISPTYDLPISAMYGAFYHGSLLYSIWFLVEHLIWAKDKIENKYAVTVLIGFLVFMLPMLLMVIIFPQFAVAIASLLCKYALLLACTLLLFSFMKGKKPLKKTEKV